MADSDPPALISLGEQTQTVRMSSPSPSRVPRVGVEKIPARVDEEDLGIPETPRDRPANLPYSPVRASLSTAGKDDLNGIDPAVPASAASRTLASEQVAAAGPFWLWVRRADTYRARGNLSLYRQASPPRSPAARLAVPAGSPKTEGDRHNLSGRPHTHTMTCRCGVSGR